MGERYRPLFKLDSGGMAEVYVAEAESMAGFKKKVAIKRILPGLIKDERFVRMFLDEARLSLHLNHANIVSVFDIGKSDNAYFIVMEYVEGSNLKALLTHMATKGRGAPVPTPVPLTVWTLNEVLKGLDYAHRLVDAENGRPLGIVHRDISPPNILISWNGEVKLTDFGLAKATTQLESTDPGVVKGKFAYLSPEAAHGLDVDHRTDIFAVGILAFEMLTGTRLFLGESDYETVELVRKAQIPDLARLNPAVPSELTEIIHRSLARAPEERYQTANEFADALLAFLFSHGLKVSARDMSTLISEMRQQQRPRETFGGSNLIAALIQDELVHFRSLDDHRGPDPAHTGSHPLGDFFDTTAPQPTYSGSSPSLSSLEVDPRGGSAMAAGMSSGVNRRPDGSVVMPLSPSRIPSPAPKREGSMVPWLVLLVVLLAGGGAYYWLVVLGNLERLG